MDAYTLRDRLVAAEKPFLEAVQVVEVVEEDAAKGTAHGKASGKIEDPASSPEPDEDAGPVDCEVCKECGPTVCCSRSECGHSYHIECLPELRNARGNVIDSANWICPPCRYHLNMAPPHSAHVDYHTGAKPFAETLNMAASLVRHSGQQHDDRCFACNQSGDLLLCDGSNCRKAYHMRCAPDLIGCTTIPDGDWFCPSCRTTSSAIVSSATTATPSTVASGSRAVTSSAASTASPGTVGAAAMPNTHVTKDSQSSATVPSKGDFLAFDGALTASIGKDEWKALLKDVQELRAKEELKCPPKYRKLTTNLYRIPKQAAKVGRREHGRRDIDDEVCKCAELSLHCAEGCVNRLLYAECNKRNCSYGEDEQQQCLNRAMQRKSNKKVAALPTPGKGWGLFAVEPIRKGEFVIEYCGEMIDDAECDRRMSEHKKNGQVYFHMLEISRNLVIDAGFMGNESRFINHSCAPNCGAEKRHIGHETRVGIFAKEDIVPGTELTYDYQFVSFADERWECQCGEATCRKFLGVNKREAIDAAALAAAGVHKELRKTIPLDHSHTPDSIGRVEGASGGRPVRGSFTMSPFNPEVFYKDRVATTCQPNILPQLRDAGVTSRELEWVKRQRIFLLGSKPKAPNKLDDGTDATDSPKKRGSRGGRGASTTHTGTKPAQGAAPRRKAGFFAAKLATMAYLAKKLPLELRRRCRPTGGRNTAHAHGADAHDVTHSMMREAWNSTTPAAAGSSKMELRFQPSKSLLAMLDTGILKWASSTYLKDADVNSGFEEVGTEHADGNDVICNKCLGSGDLLCCDGCPRAFHLSCINMSVYDVPQGRWLCNECRKLARTSRRSVTGAFGKAPHTITGFPPQDADVMVMLASIAPPSESVHVPVDVEAALIGEADSVATKGAESGSKRQRESAKDSPVRRAVKARRE